MNDEYNFGPDMTVRCHSYVWVLKLVLLPLFSSFLFVNVL